MPSKNTTLKPSFFKEYFHHKLRGLKKFTITFAIMNFLIYTVFSAILLIQMIEVKRISTIVNYSISTHSYLIATMMIAFIAALIFAAEGIIIIVMAAINLKSYHSRSAMDTIGGLPLTVTQRFWGDILSGIASFMISFIPCAVSSLVMMAVLQYGVDPESGRYTLENGGLPNYAFPRFHDNYLILAALLILTVLICVLAAYTITCFVTSCCGRLNASIIFSILTVCAIPLINATFNAYIYNNAIGIIGDDYVKVVSALPPVGTAISLVDSLFLNSFYNYEFTVATPKLIIMLAFIVLPIIGSYLIAKHRKAEGVDKLFIYKPAYIVVSLIITASALGLTLVTLDSPAFYVPLILFALAACIYIEYLRTHSKRTFWVGILRFIGSAAVCAAFGLFAYNTDGFNIGKKLPAESKIESIDFYYLDETAIMRPVHLDDSNVISAVLSEHKKITGNLEKFSLKREGNYTSIYGRDGNLNLRYNLTDGTSTQRVYHPLDAETDKLIHNFKTAIRSMPEVQNRTLLGLLGNPDMPCTEIVLNGYDNKPVNSNTIKPSAQDEFIRCIKSDMLNNDTYAVLSANQIGSFIYSYIDRSGTKQREILGIYNLYEETNKFLSDPNNYVTDFSFDINDSSAVYSVTYWRDNYSDKFSDTISNSNTAVLKCDVRADSAAARELISYFETEYTASGEYSGKITVYTNGNTLRIKKENERAALSALIKVMKEQETRGEL